MAWSPIVAWLLASSIITDMIGTAITLRYPDERATSRTDSATFGSAMMSGTLITSPRRIAHRRVSYCGRKVSRPRVR